MENQTEKKACKNCIHYQMCLDSYREGVRQGENLDMSEEEYFADTFGCNFYADERIYRKQEWISVEERLPENDGNIITYQGNYQEIDMYYYCGNGQVVDNRGDFASFQYYGITHWMPLPEAPKGVVDGKAD